MTKKEMEARKKSQSKATNEFVLDIFRARRAKNMRLCDLGKAVGLSTNQAGVLCNNPDKMSLAHLRDICNVLELPMTNFLVAYGFLEEQK